MAESNTQPPQGVTPYLTVHGATDAVEFYKQAFGAEELGRVPADDGKRLMHCCLRINGGQIMMSDDFPEHGYPLDGNPKGVTMHLTVDDADKWWNRAVSAGARILLPLDLQFWGDRYGQLADPFGHTWSISSPARK